MKKLLSALILTCLCISVSGQATFTQLPETPLTYLGYELTSPVIKAGYTKRTQYYGSQPFVFQIGAVLQKKYADLPIYEFFSEKSDFISYVESQTTVTRTASYVAYTVQARSSDSDPFVTYAKDTFFLSGTSITSISETIYDTESETENTIDTYATYDVVYHANGKIERIKLKKSMDQNSVFFAGVSVAYNANNTLKTDSTFQFQYDGSGEKSVYVSSYQDHYYKAANALQPDSTFYNQTGSDPLLNTKFAYTLNTNNEILEAIGYVYDQTSDAYENKFYYDFGQEPSLGILSASPASIIALYPNPVQDLINIPADCSFQFWSISSVAGMHVKNGTNSDLNKISVADLRSGVYVLTLNSADQTWVSKFVK